MEICSINPFFSSTAVTVVNHGLGLESRECYSFSQLFLFSAKADQNVFAVFEGYNLQMIENFQIYMPISSVLSTSQDGNCLNT